MTFSQQLLAIMDSNGIVATKVRSMNGTAIQGVIIAKNKNSNNSFLLENNPIIARMSLDFTNNGKLLDSANPDN